MSAIVILLLLFCSSCMVDVKTISNPQNESSDAILSSTPTPIPTSASVPTPIDEDPSYPTIKNLILDDSMTSHSDVYINPVLVATKLSDEDTVEIYDNSLCIAETPLAKTKVQDNVAIINVMLPERIQKNYQFYGRRVNNQTGVTSPCSTVSVSYHYTPPIPSLTEPNSIIDTSAYYRQWTGSTINRVVTDSSGNYVKWLALYVYQHKQKKTHLILRDNVNDPEPSFARNYICLLPTNTTNGITKVLSSFKFEDIPCVKRTNLYKGLGYIFHRLSVDDINKFNGAVAIVADAFGKVVGCTEDIYRTTFNHQAWNKSILTCRHSGGYTVLNSIDQLGDALQAIAYQITLDWAININAQNEDIYHHLLFK